MMVVYGLLFVVDCEVLVEGCCTCGAMCVMCCGVCCVLCDVAGCG